MITIKEIINDSDVVIREAGQFPDDVINNIFHGSDFLSDYQIRFPDLYTPLLNGKQWLYKYLKKYQPRTADILLNSGDLIVVGNKEYTENYIFHLIQEVNGFVVEINRNTHGWNMSDNNFKPQTNLLHRESRFYSIPEKLRLAYYNNFDGLNVPYSIGIGIQKYLLPLPSDSWNSIDRYLSSIRLKKKYLPIIEKIFPDVVPEDKSDPYVNLMKFMDSRPNASGIEGDVFFVKNNIQDGKIYYIRDGDVSNIMTLSEPLAAIDKYCEHILLRKKGRFNFLPYSVKL